MAGTGAAAFFVFLLLYSFVIQDDYRSEWIRENRLLTRMMALTPDAGPDTLLVVHRPWYGEPLFPTGPRRPSIDFQVHGVVLGFSRVFLDYQGPTVFVVYDEQWRSQTGLSCGRKAILERARFRRFSAGHEGSGDSGSYFWWKSSDGKCEAGGHSVLRGGPPVGSGASAGTGPAIEMGDPAAVAAVAGGVSALPVLAVCVTDCNG